MKLSHRSAICLLTAFLLSGCLIHSPQPGVSLDQSTDQIKWSKTELIFGRSIEDGGVVTDEDWEQFIRSVVTPLFPDGFTVWNAKGSWRNDAGQIITEESKVLLIVHTDIVDNDRHISEIIRAYKSTFRSEFRASDLSRW